MDPQTLLDDAKTQYHLLITGQQAKVYVDQNGERVEYTQANRSALKTYIDELQQLVDRAAGKKSHRGPMKVIF